MIQVVMGAVRAIPALARTGSGAARAGGAAAKSGAVKGIEHGTNAAVAQMTYGALSHVGQRRQQPAPEPYQTYDRFPGY
ncbi:hypothetical protein [Nonomuraea typhae]|uniref:DUF4235 domain-containing protein n=1 Tax=Nonomuraea typhae TaxID=2603600 RepID=A0ABW7YJ71_9ACTN